MRNARPVRGPWRTLRNRTNAVLIAILFALPWIRIAGEPLILLDIPRRQFHTFGLVIFPQELYFLWLLLACLVLCLFFFTALGGRLWCGYGCPQTVFTDLFAALARRIEGWSGSRRRLSVPLWRSLTLHAVWISLGLLVGFHLVGYFVSPYRWLSPSILGSFSGSLPGWLTEASQAELPRSALAWVFGIGGLAYLDFAVLRQRFCKVLCPYARFQSVLFDRETLVIAYDPERGEPRGKRSRTSGDCVDCGLCVAVCPSEIDIRNGLQLECIACTQCIDACNGVMRNTKKPLDLIGYRSLASLEKNGRTHILRPRVVIYGALLAVAVVAFGVALVRRQPLELAVSRNRTALFTNAASGEISNAYTLEIENRSRSDRRYRLRIEEPEFQLIAGLNPVPVPATTHLETRVFVLASPGSVSAAETSSTRVSGSREIHFVLEDIDDAERQVKRASRFIAPTETIGSGETPH